MEAVKSILEIIVLFIGLFLAIGTITFIIRGIEFLCIQIYDYFHPFGWK